MPWSKSTGSIPEIESVEECKSLMDQDLIILFKHSPTCPVSWMAHREVMRLRTEQPNLPLYLISVRRRRDVARFIENQTSVQHESPQILVLRRGRVVGSASHDEVTATTIQDFIDIDNGKENIGIASISEKTA